ncbi:MAG: sugar transferase [Candidatus Eremiobacterota bacterium]
MHKEHELFFKVITGILDIFIVIFSYIIAYTIRLKFFPTPLLNQAEYISPPYGLALFFTITWITVFISLGLYKTYRTKSLSVELMDIFKAVSLGVLVTGVSVFFFKLIFVSRAIIILFWFFSLLFLSAERVTMRYILRIYRRKGYNYRMILIAGTGKRAKEFLRVVNENKDWGLKVIGFLSSKKNMTGKHIMTYPVLGTFNDAHKIISKSVVDILVLAPSIKNLETMSELIKVCEIEGIDTYVMSNFLGLSFAEMKLENFHGLPMLLFHTTPHDQWKLLLKRGIDIFISTIALILCLPLFMVIAILIKLNSKGPVFFSQIRAGLNGRKFRLYKFRTMEEGAEEKIEELRKYNEMTEPVFKMKDDPRVTGTGAILRKTSLDELPQLYNVWKGEMSIVGPRPPIPEEVEKYKRWQRRRLSMKPGLTCLWQVNGRNNLDFDQWMKLDLEYIDNWSLALDIKIILKTFPVILMGTGAQ